MSSHQSILEKCRRFRARPVRGGVKLSGAEALWLEALLTRLARLDRPPARPPLTAEQRNRIKVAVDARRREIAQSTARVDQALERELYRNAS